MNRKLENRTSGENAAFGGFAFLGLCLAVWAAIATAPAWGAQELFLDLTTPAVADAERAQKFGCVGGGLTGTSDGRIYIPPRPTLRLEITRLNGDTFRVGDEIACEIRVTNTGSKAILIPWSVDPGILRSPKCEWLVKTQGTVGVTLMLGLNLVDQDGYSGFTVAHELFGISSDPATVRTLGTHESLRVKMADKVNVYAIQQSRAQANRGSLNLPQRFVLAGALDWDDSAVFGAYSRVQSDNLLHVIISKGE